MLEEIEGNELMGKIWPVHLQEGPVVKRGLAKVSYVDERIYVTFGFHETLRNGNWVYSEPTQIFGHKSVTRISGWEKDGVKIKRISVSYTGTTILVYPAGTPVSSLE